MIHEHRSRQPADHAPEPASHGARPYEPASHEPQPDRVGTQDAAAARWAQQVRSGAGGTVESTWDGPSLGPALAFGTAPADYPAAATFDAFPPAHDAHPPAHDANPSADDAHPSAHDAHPPAHDAHPPAQEAYARTPASPAHEAHATPPTPPTNPPYAALPPHAPGSGPRGDVSDLRRAGRRRWMGLGGTAAAAALLASMGTATLTGAFDDDVSGLASGSPDRVVNAAPVSSTGDASGWETVAAAVRESVVALDVVTSRGQGAGSGVLLDADGHVLTNNHVVDGARSGGIVVSLADGRMFEAEIVGTDPATDLAVVRLVDPPTDLEPATLGSSADVAVGEPVVAVGNPLGLDSTVTTGIVSALDRPVTTAASSDPRSGPVVTNAIQVDAAINPGNSGGPLFDADGRVIGITSSIATLSNGGAAGSIGLGFAIPVDQAAAVADQLIETGAAEHAFLGVSLADTTTTVDGTTRAGALVQRVEAGTPAQRAGLREGDVITEIGDRYVGGSAALTGYVRQYASGEKATLTVVRDGKSAQVDVTLAAREQLGA